MGYEWVQGHVSACLSRHNSPRDIEHDALWADFGQRLRALVEEDRYKPILLDVASMDEVEQ